MGWNTHWLTKSMTINAGQLKSLKSTSRVKYKVANCRNWFSSPWTAAIGYLELLSKTSRERVSRAGEVRSPSIYFGRTFLPCYAYTAFYWGVSVVGSACSEFQALAGEHCV